MISTYNILKLAHACGPGRRPVAGHDAANACVFRGFEQGALRIEDEPVHGADQDVDPGEGRAELLLSLCDVPWADLNAGRAECLCGRLRERCGPDQGGDALE